MKKAIALLLALVTLLSLTACAGKEDTASSALDQIKQKGELVVGTSADYPPYGGRYPNQAEAACRAIRTKDLTFG